MRRNLCSEISELLMRYFMKQLESLLSFTQLNESSKPHRMHYWLLISSNILLIIQLLILINWFPYLGNMKISSVGNYFWMMMWCVMMPRTVTMVWLRCWCCSGCGWCSSGRSCRRGRWWWSHSGIWCWTCRWTLGMNSKLKQNQSILLYFSIV